MRWRTVYRRHTNRLATVSQLVVGACAARMPCVRRSAGMRRDLVRGRKGERYYNPQVTLWNQRQLKIKPFIINLSVKGSGSG